MSDSTAVEPLRHAGQLEKWTSYLSGWQPRWLEIDALGRLLYYYTQERQSGCRGYLRLAAAAVAVDPSNDTRFSVVAPTVTLQLRAKTSQDRQKWILALTAAKLQSKQDEDVRLLSGSSSGGDISQAVATSSNASSMSINSDTTPFALKSSAESEAAAAAAAAEAAAAEAARAQALQAHQQFAEELYQRAQILRQHLRTQADEVRTRLRQVNLTADQQKQVEGAQNSVASLDNSCTHMMDFLDQLCAHARRGLSLAGAADRPSENGDQLLSSSLRSVGGSTDDRSSELTPRAASPADQDAHVPQATSTPMPPARVHSTGPPPAAAAWRSAASSVYATPNSEDFGTADELPAEAQGHGPSALSASPQPTTPNFVAADGLNRHANVPKPIPQNSNLSSSSREQHRGQSTQSRHQDQQHQQQQQQQEQQREAEGQQGVHKPAAPQADVSGQARVSPAKVQATVALRQTGPPSFFLTAGRHFAQVRTAENGDIDLKEFLEACRSIVTFVDKLGSTTFAPVKADMMGNINKLAAAHDLHKDCETVQDLIHDEIETGSTTKKNSSTDALLWLKRGLEFVQKLLSQVSRSGDEVSTAATAAYTATLSRYHGWVVRGIFNMAMRAVPGRANFIASLGPAPADTVLRDMRDYSDALGRLLMDINRFYADNNLDPGP